MLFEKQKQARERFCCMKGIMTLLKKGSQENLGVI